MEAWSAITRDSWALSILRKGYRIPFAREPPLSLSPILFPVAQQHLNHLREEVQILLEKKAVEIVRDTTSLQPDFLSEEENRPFFSSHYRPIIAQQNDEGRLLSNGNCGLHSESYSSRGLGGFYRLYGRIPPYSYSSSVSQVPEIFPRRHYITISGASIRNLNSAFRFYNLDGDCGGTYSISRTKHSPIFRRLACPSSFQSLLSDLSLAWEIITSLGLIPNPLKSDLVPSQDFVYAGMRFLTHIGIVRVPEESHQNSCPSISGSTGSIHYLPRILSMLGSLNASADLVQLGRLHTRPLRVHLLANWKPHRDSLVQPIPISHSCRVAIKWWMNPSIYVAGIPLVIPAPDFHLFSDDSHSGWGAHLEPLGLEVQGLWDVASQDLHINNLELRAVFLALQHFQSHLQFLRDGSVRQFISSGLPQEARGDPLSISVHASMGASLLCHHRNIHIQVRHIPGKLNVLADSLSRPDEFSPPNGL